MTEAQPAHPATGSGVAPRVPEAAEPAAASGAYSKDYWDNVFEQVGRRPFVKFCLAVLAVLYASAIYAPLVANDRPYVLEAVDRSGYESSLRTVYVASLGLSGLVKKTPDEFVEELSPAATVRSYPEALSREAGAVETSIGTMRRSLDEELHEPLDRIGEEARRAVELALAGDHEAAAEAADDVKERARALRAEYRAADPAAEGAGGVELRARTSYPLFEAVTWVEAFFMWLWACVLTWPLWNRFVNRVLLGGSRERVRRARKRKLAAVLGSSAVVAALWAATIGGEAVFETSQFKQNLTAGADHVERAVFPPLAIGFAESHVAERFRPPTWRANAEMTPEGAFVRGPRAPRPDPQTGMLPRSRPVEVRYGEPGLNSPFRHLLGTDSLGRDLFVRILYGGRISLSIGIFSTVLLVFIGVVMGALAGYLGKGTDILISRIIEVFQSFPAFFLILTAVALIPEDKLHPVFAITFFIALVRWTGVARLTRGEFLRLKEQEFVISARALGFSMPRIVFRHVLPNAMGPVLVAGAFSVAAGILTETAISYLGFGVQLPIPSWGSLVSEARDFEYWWLLIFPGVMIFVTVFCYNMVGEGVRDALDPRRRV